MDDIKKKSDESWKDSVDKEKEILKEEKDKFNIPEPDFKFFVTTLSLQASISLGVIANPVSNKQEEDLTQAKFLIDTLDMLKEKTKGNLNEDEAGFLENVLYELKMAYVSKQKGNTK